MLFGAALAGCAPDGAEQRLIATGELLAADGETPLVGARINKYRLTFLLEGEAGPVQIQRDFRSDAAGHPIVCNAQGRFAIANDDLALAYEWERDERMCGTVCVAWDTVCHEVREEVCLSSCSEDTCWDECWDECTPECWDETVCDDVGDCWAETVCVDSCVEECAPVCETTSYPCECFWDSHERCSDECVEHAEQCEWVTRVYTTHPALDRVDATRAELWLDGDGDTRRVIGTPIEAHQFRGCDDAGRCTPLDLWVQRDRFVAPPQ
jgi:hypothetical protein